MVLILELIFGVFTSTRDFKVLISQDNRFFTIALNLMKRNNHVKQENSSIKTINLEPLIYKTRDIHTLMWIISKGLLVTPHILENGILFYFC